MNLIRPAATGLLFLLAVGKCLAQPASGAPGHTMAKADPAKLQAIESAWEKNITGEEHNRSCDTAMGEDIGWLMTPVLGGFYYGYLATGDTKWLDLETDWLDSWIKRAVTEPDGYPGWPKLGAAGTDKDHLNDYDADSLLGEAMVLRYAVLTADKIEKTPALEQKYGEKARTYLALSERIYKKWDERGAWRDTAGGGMISVVLPFGIDPKTGQWTAGYATRNDPGQGFSHPENKANLTALWLLAMFDATGKPVYHDRAQKWFTLLKSRMHVNAAGTYDVWNYWEPAGPWDYTPTGATKHWVGVHPRAGYYEIDLEGIVTAYQHGLVFDQADIDRLIATAHATGRYWEALVPYDGLVQQKFEEGLKPGSWGGLESAPRYLYEQKQLPAAP